MMGILSLNDTDRRRDRLLVRRILSGDRHAFEQFFERHTSGLYRFAGSRLPADSDALHEVVQTTLVKAIESLPRYRGDGALGAWLFGICRFEISAFYRQRRRGDQVELLEEDPEVLAAAPSQSSPGSELELRERTQQIHATLDSLPSHYSEALEWKYLDGLSVSQIAARLRLSTKAAESLLTRARKAFRQIFSAAVGGSGTSDAKGSDES